MVISNPQLLLLIAVRGVSSPPLLSKTILFYFIWVLYLVCDDCLDRVPAFMHGGRSDPD